MVFPFCFFLVLFCENKSPILDIKATNPQLIYCEEATKFEKISHLFKNFLGTYVKTKQDIFSNFCGLLRISEL